MKILKVKIQREKHATGQETHYIYPFEYDPKKIQVLCYESMLPENHTTVVNRGDTYEYLIGVVEDVDAMSFLVSSDIEELTKADAIILGDQWVRKTDKVVDLEKVTKILAKQVLGQALTQMEQDALDPTKSEIGINATKSFTEIIETYIP